MNPSDIFGRWWTPHFLFVECPEGDGCIWGYILCQVSPDGPWKAIAASGTMFFGSPVLDETPRELASGTEDECRAAVEMHRAQVRGEMH